MSPTIQEKLQKLTTSESFFKSEPTAPRVRVPSSRERGILGVKEIVNWEEKQYLDPQGEKEVNRKRWNSMQGKSIKCRKTFLGLTMPVEEVFGKDGKPIYVRKEVAWKVYKTLPEIMTKVEIKDYNPDSETYGQMIVQEKAWSIKIYKTDDAKVGEIRIYGPERKIPRVSELGQVLFELSKLGLFVTAWHENTGLVSQGDPVTYDGYAVESMKDWIARYEKSYSRVVSTLGLRITEKYVAKYGASIGSRLAEGHIKKLCKAPWANPKNLWGYGRKNRDEENSPLVSTEKQKLDIAFKFPCSKVKRSGKRSKGGGGGAYRLGTQSVVQREFEKVEKHPKCIASVVAERVNAIMVQEADDQFEKPSPGRLGLIKELVEKLDQVIVRKG